MRAVISDSDSVWLHRHLDCEKRAKKEYNCQKQSDNEPKYGDDHRCRKYAKAEQCVLSLIVHRIMMDNEKRSWGTRHQLLTDQNNTIKLPLSYRVGSIAD